MQAVGLYKYLPIDAPESLVDVEIPKPAPGEHDLLVRVKAVSVNPVDVKVRAPKDKVEKEPKILGWDAAGVVEEVGKNVSTYKPGDEIYYAGDITRPGCNSEYHAVNERIVGHKPKSLTFEEAAALPLTTITAWEAIFDRLGITRPEYERANDKSILIIGGAGGVGSIAIQLAKKLAKLTVVSTASRKESVKWCKKMGADYTIDHFQSIRDQLEKLKVNPDYILCLNSPEKHLGSMAEVIGPQGKICSILGLEKANPKYLSPLFQKSISLSWELMFTRPMFQTHDMEEQRRLLNVCAKLIDEGIITSTITERYGKLNAENLIKAHQKIESGHTVGKVVLSGIE